MPFGLEYPNDEEGAEEAPDMKRGQHGRHQISKKKVHVIHKIGPKGEPLEPTIIIGTFSNQCSCIVREKVPITYADWRKVPKDIKGNVWG